MSALFSPAELDRIQQAVAEAEATCHGEIVPAFAKQSDGYEVATWRAGVAGALLSATLVLAVNAFTDLLLWIPLPALGLLVLLAGGIGMALSEVVPAVKRAFAGKRLMAERVAEQAHVLFLENQVFDTEQRSGIQLFVSFFERRIELIADTGIRSAVPPEKWDAVVTSLTKKLQSADNTAAIIAAIHELAQLVVESGIELEMTDNELGNELRIDE